MLLAQELHESDHGKDAASLVIDIVFLAITVLAVLEFWGLLQPHVLLTLGTGGLAGGAVIRHLAWLH